MSDVCVVSHLVALFDDALSAAGEAELVADVAGALHEVSVLQLTIAVCTLEQLTSSSSSLASSVAGAGHLVWSGAWGGGASLSILNNNNNVT